MINDFKKDLHALREAVESVIRNNVEISDTVDEEKAVHDFNERKKVYYLKTMNSALGSVKRNSSELNNLIEFDRSNQQPVYELMELMTRLDGMDGAKIKQAVESMMKIADTLKFPEIDEGKLFSLPSRIPSDIRNDITADLNELNKCFNSECYRSVVIICGRILEAALHRKYFEVTGNDLLEKNPGIGLGKLIARLDEKDVKFEPGLTQQIHLINQVRVFSVHKKQDAFYPTRPQAHAIVLYTVDVIGKIFGG